MRRCSRAWIWVRHFGGWICAELVDCSGENGSKEVWLDKMDAFLRMV